MNSVLNSDQSAPASKPASETMLGELLASEGKLSELDIGRVIMMQRQQKLRFGEAALRLGLVNKDDLTRALAKQFDYPYTQPTGSGLAPALFAAHQPFSLQSEAVRALRSQLAMRWFDNQRPTMMVTAARRAQGSSCLAANLAIAFAQAGERTLLIDANFRAPAQHALFGVDGSEGLSSLLTGRANIKHILQTVEPFERLHVLCSGPVPPNPQELLGRVSFSYLIETAPASFDVIIVDSPAALEYGDAQLIASRAGGCLISARRNVTRCNDLRRMESLLIPAGVQLLGAVLNE